MKKYKKIIFILIMMLGIYLIGFQFIMYTYNYYTRFYTSDKILAEQKKLDSNNINFLEKSAEDYKSSIDTQGKSIVDPFYMEKYNIKSITDQKDLGLLEIPKLDLYQVIYETANKNNLLKGVGKVEGTDFPIGKINNRCVLAGHRGLNKKNGMFLYLDKLEKGDVVYLYTLGKKLRYIVNDKEIILPTENDKLLPIKDKDILTLLTCHPYPINNKRLIVNCIRDELDEKSDKNKNLNLESEYIMIDKSVRYYTAINKIISLICIIIFIYLLILLKKETLNLIKNIKKGNK